jgi:hypothetical protein
MNIINQETGETTTLELQSQDIGDLAKALTKAQGVMTSASKDGTNPHFGKSYATLDSIWQAIRKPLSEHGLCVVQSILPDNTLVTTLLHESGQWMRSYLKLNPVRNDPQGIGSALTYGRRYSLAAIVGICQADDDGDDASERPTGRPASEPASDRKSTPKPAAVPAAAAKPTNGGDKKQPDPFTYYWEQVKASGLEKQKGLDILAQCKNDPSRAVDVLLGMAQDAQPA